MSDIQKVYWDGRYQAGGKIWGDSPSKTAVYAERICREQGAHIVLIPGSGYGRHTRYFKSRGYEVEGIEVSQEAVKLADPDIKCYLGSVLGMPYSDRVYDAVYCFNVLHLLFHADRIDFIRKCANQLKPGGLAFFVAFSEKDGSYGKGKEVEPGTFESKPGRPVHYFTEADMKEHFREFDIKECSVFMDEENHGSEGAHVHMVRYLLGYKKKG